jgi:hypothetical protein
LSAVGNPDHEAGSSRTFGIDVDSFFFGNGEATINKSKNPSESPFNKNVSRSDSERVMLLIGGIEVVLTGYSLVDDADNEVTGIDTSDSN